MLALKYDLKFICLKNSSSAIRNLLGNPYVSITALPSWPLVPSQDSIIILSPDLLSSIDWPASTIFLLALKAKAAILKDSIEVDIRYCKSFKALILVALSSAPTNFDIGFPNVFIPVDIRLTWWVTGFDSIEFINRWLVIFITSEPFWCFSIIFKALGLVAAKCNFLTTCCKALVSPPSANFKICSTSNSPKKSSSSTISFAACFLASSTASSSDFSFNIVFKPFCGILSEVTFDSARLLDIGVIALRLIFKTLSKNLRVKAKSFLTTS